MVIMLEKSGFLTDNTETNERTRLPSINVSQPCFKTSRTGDKPISILFEYVDTTIIKSFNYINLYSKHYDRNIGIVLFFTNATVNLFGTHLDKLFLELSASNVTSINEHYSKPAANDEMQNHMISIVKTIEVIYKNEELNKDIATFKNKGFDHKYDEAS